MLDKRGVAPVKALAQTDKRSKDPKGVPLTGLKLHNLRVLFP